MKKLLLCTLLSLTALVAVNPASLQAATRAEQRNSVREAVMPYVARKVMDVKPQTLLPADKNTVSGFNFSHAVTLDDGSEWMTYLGDLPESALLNLDVYLVYISKPQDSSGAVPVQKGWIGFALVNFDKGQVFQAISTTDYLTVVSAEPLGVVNKLDEFLSGFSQSVRDYYSRNRSRLPKSILKLADIDAVTSLIALSDGSKWVVSEEIDKKMATSTELKINSGDTANIVVYNRGDRAFGAVMVNNRPYELEENITPAK